MKNVARQYFWWPKLDSQVESCAKQCNICRSSAPNSNKAVLIKFEENKEALHRMHIDFLDPLNGQKVHDHKRCVYKIARGIQNVKHNDEGYGVKNEGFRV